MLDIMMKTIITTNKAPQAIGPYSQAVKTGQFLFCSGQIPLDSKTGEKVGTTIEAQTRQVMENIKGLLASQGLDFQNIIKTTVFLLDMNDYGAFNPIYAEYFAKNPPARSTIQVARLPLDVLIEIEVIAVIG